MQRFGQGLAVLGVVCGLSTAVGAQTVGMMVTDKAGDSSAVREFYRGNTVYMVIGSAAGGGFDTYARIIARYLTKHMPGNPSLVPQNLPGAGGVAAGTRVAVTAPQDGTYVGAIHPATIVAPVLGEKNHALKPLNLAFLGSASANLEACYVRTDAPVKSLADAYDTEIVMGASNQGSSSREYAALLKNVLGLKIKIVGGYTGSADILLALERGEVQATCGAGLFSTVSSRPKWFADKIVKVLSHQGPRAMPEIKELQGAPPTVSLAKTEEQREILNLYDLQGPIGRPYATGGDVPVERLKALQAAFMAAMADPDLKTEVLAKGLEISPLSGDEVQAIAGQFYNASPAVVKKLRTALGYD